MTSIVLLVACTGNVEEVKKVKVQKWALPEVAEQKIDHSTIPYELLSHIERREGVGDKVTNIPTGAYGVTNSARRAVQAPESMKDDEVALMYLLALESRWERIEGFSEAPKAIKEALLDATYNIGTKVTRFWNTRKALKRGDYDGVAKRLLLTANVGKKSLKGLALRRAESYNGFAEDKITEVIQLDDGTIKYMKGQEVFVEYKPSGGKHEKSLAGSSVITDFDELLYSRYG